MDYGVFESIKWAYRKELLSRIIKDERKAVWIISRNQSIWKTIFTWLLTPRITSQKALWKNDGKIVISYLGYKQNGKQRFGANGKIIPFTMLGIIRRCAGVDMEVVSEGLKDNNYDRYCTMTKERKCSDMHIYSRHWERRWHGLGGNNHTATIVDTC